MNNKIFKNDDAQKRLEDWYDRFLTRVDGRTKLIEVSTSYGINHILLAGDPSNPPLVCLHSMLTSSAHLVSELGTLLDRFYIVAPDLPGQSVKGLAKRLPYTDNSHAEWLQEILVELNLMPVNLLGVSLGAFIARQYALNNPVRVKSLILIVPAGIVQGSLVKGFTKMALPMIMYKIRPTEKRLRQLVEPLISNWDEDWAMYLGDAFNDFRPSFKIPPLASDEELKKLAMPCLVIGAENDISFPGLKLIERAGKHIPDIETELIKNSRHCPPTTPEFRNWLGKRVKSFIDNSAHKITPTS